MRLNCLALLGTLVISAISSAPCLAADPHAALAPDTAEASGSSDIRTRYILQDPRGRVILDEYFAGRFQLITFGYTSCPSVCPGTLAIMALVLKNLGPLAEQVQPIFISVDPERDTPEILGRYVKNFDDRIMGLTGTPDYVRGAANNFKVSYAKHQDPGAPANEYSVDHSVGIYLVGPDGRFLTRYGYSVSAQDISDRLKPRIETYNAERKAKTLEDAERAKAGKKPAEAKP